MSQNPLLQPRAWGSRFDSLPTSPPASPLALHSTSSFTRSDMGIAHVLSDFHKKEDDKMPHDASIFVGSLPSSVEQRDLARLLSEHLSDHAEVKNVKVVRDSKGGVCAFVQCENAVMATNLIKTLHASPPKPFLGRTLRYEPARAFRTLLISYRIPMQYTTNPHTDTPIDQQQTSGKVQLNLPYAMRLWKPKSSKFYALLYNDEAVLAEHRAAMSHSGESSLFLQPLSFNAETIHRLVSHFGGLESFNMIHPNGSNPFPHNTPRSEQMDTGCWEVKWGFRDDCVSALMALRRVPHLTVTWAHQPQTAHHGQRSPFVDNSRAHLEAENPSQSFRPSPSFQTAKSTKVLNNCLPSISVNPADGTARGRAKWSEMDFPPLGIETRDTKHSFSPESSPALTSSTQEDSNLDVPQDIDVPSTPGLVMSPTTARTVESPFTTTPTSAEGDIPPAIRSQSSTDFCSNMSRAGKELDPTTLFVGGLEMFGPTAWDEAKVENFFAKFGGLEHVKVVRPPNSRAAFAFVKFNNTESPARAVSEEHNRVYEGRAMRVQFRDFNPSRGSSWKPLRGRGGRHFYPNPHRRSSEPVAIPVELKTDQAVAEAGSQQIAIIKADGLDSTNGLHEQGPSEDTQPVECPQNTSQKLGSLPEISTQSEPYREWYDSPPQANTASLALENSTTTPIVPSPLPFPIVNNGAYPLPPWMHPFPIPIPYYGAFPPYMPQIPQPMGTVAEGNGNLAGQLPPNNYGSFIPYLSPRPQSADETQNHPGNGQPPLCPAGFIQNDQGALVAVYQPEALDQYMANSQLNSATPTPQMWPQYPSHFPFQGTSFPSAMVPRQYAQNGPPMTWVPGATAPNYLPTPSTGVHNSTPNFALSTRMAHSEPTSQPLGPSPRKQSRRNDHQGANTRNPQSRPFPNRANRESEFARQLTRGASTHAGGGEWNSWSSAS